ncbi:hypothetical protein QSH18_14335 [Xanthomonas sp. NCPPB 2654]|uniref:hypothetical protein n=1 Tax=unclassified Xanthomonas TaxID=2643310 RepID=UPI0021E05243|nr:MULTISPECIES: hypothetical protein [unclassified Xanthomonas]MDL5366784.1 hypothetical protein [Xanthomonas sp. NCPPB 2654]MEB1529127.1 hypothetical protein [Xanthomonas campestris pv. campestris]UYC20063.1 hypothetical protein NUG20_18115 [Xanthomonas sp. CFBP 8443]
MKPLDLVGWAATLILVATLLRQIHKQWRAPDVQAVSAWLFVGQISASLLFIVYSAALRNYVFVATNTLVLLTAVAGQLLQTLKRRRLREHRERTS